MNPNVVALFVGTDLVVTAIVVALLLRRRRFEAPGGAGLDPRKVAVITREVEARADTWMRANWSGDPDTLPAAIAALIEALEADLAARGVPLEHAQLRVIVGRLIDTRGFARGQDVREAMRKVA